MARQHLSKDDLEIVGACLTAAVDGPFFPDWQFSTLFGLDRAEVASVTRAWPDVSDEDEIADRAVNNALRNLAGYPRSEDLSRFVAADPTRLFAILEKWRLGQA
jgi:hypothetical protein